jgi:plastocyanin
MKHLHFVLSLAVVAAALPSARAGDLSGTVTLKGTPPPEADIAPLKDDPNCGKLHPTMPKTRFYVVGPGGGLADVVVVVKGVPGATSGGAAAAPIVLDQKGCEYTPYVMAVQTGQKIMARNSDPVAHNVHSVPMVAGNMEKNNSQVPGQGDLPFTFTKPENFLKFQCDIHNWMFAYVSVFDHPYFAVTDKDGKFTIKNVPDGKFTVQAFHRKAAPASSPASKEVEVKGASTADFVLEVKAK